MIIIRKLGKYSEKSLKLINLTFPSIRLPIIINSGDTALAGIALINGNNIRDKINAIPATTVDNPVLAPEAIPTALSRATTVELLPNIPAKILDIPVA